MELPYAGGRKEIVGPKNDRCYEEAKRVRARRAFARARGGKSCRGMARTYSTFWKRGEIPRCCEGVGLPIEYQKCTARESTSL